MRLQTRSGAWSSEVFEAALAEQRANVHRPLPAGISPDNLFERLMASQVVWNVLETEIRHVRLQLADELYRGQVVFKDEPGRCGDGECWTEGSLREDVMRRIPAEQVEFNRVGWIPLSHLPDRLTFFVDERNIIDGVAFG